MGLLEAVLILSSIFGIYSAVQPELCPVVVVVPENNRVEILGSTHVKEYTLQVDCKKLIK